MLQNKANSAVCGPYFCSYFCRVCGGWGFKKNPHFLILGILTPLGADGFLILTFQGVRGGGRVELCLNKVCDRHQDHYGCSATEWARLSFCLRRAQIMAPESPPGLTLIFLSLLFPKSKDFSFSSEPLKFLGEKGKCSKSKEFLTKEKKARNSQKARKRRLGH